MVAVLAAILLGGCLLQGTKPTGPPPPERERSISSSADAQRISRARIRIAAQRGGASMVKAYHLAKADAWLDFAADAGRNEAGADTAEDALDQAESLIGALERSRTPPLRTLHVVASSSIREDLWAAVDEIKNSAAFPCAGALLARAEVALVWAGHKAFIGDTKAADEVVARAEAYFADTRSEAARCLAVEEPRSVQPVKPSPSQPPAATPTSTPAPAPPFAPATPPGAAPDTLARPADADVPASRQIERVQLPTDSFFPFGAARLDPARSEPLRDLAQRIRLAPDVVAVRIHGHTDRLSRSGSRYNHRLSSSRARAVGKALVA